MENKLLKKFSALSFIFLLTASCGGVKSLISTTPKPTEDECLKRSITKQIDSNPKLSEIPVFVESVSNGNVKLRISANNERPIPDKTILAIRKGESLQNIQKYDKSVDFLIDFEKQLKRMSKIKTVAWAASEPCAPGFVCQTTGSSEKSADEDEIDALCAEYGK